MTPLTGHCLCGQSRWSYDGPKRRNLICHCSDCIRGVGGAVIGFVNCAPEQLSLSGPVASFESSSRTWRGFCSQCGSSLYFKSDKWPDAIHMTAATLSEGTQYRPDAEVCLSSAMHWTDRVAERFDGFADAPQPAGAAQ